MLYSVSSRAHTHQNGQLLGARRHPLTDSGECRSFGRKGTEWADSSNPAAGARVGQSLLGPQRTRGLSHVRSRAALLMHVARRAALHLRCATMTHLSSGICICPARRAPRPSTTFHCSCYAEL